MRHLLLYITFFFLIISCNTNSNRPAIIGSWVKPVKYSIDAIEGITLNSDSSVYSINIDINYLSWKQEGEKIILNRRLQNDTLIIEKLSEKELVFFKNGIEYRYFRISDSLANKATTPIEIIVDTLAHNLK